ncbi:MAG: 1-phosphofructokinase family hexose kinase [wastewater metagenome]|nr:1-phosphofructokinase family hexose kinase [Candidatus Loosdrechtia aerotolerans]
MQTIVTVTINPTIDASCSVDYVVADRKLRGKSPHREPGGGGINVSRAIKKLGGESVAIYTSGGPIGQMLQALLDQENINHYPISIEEITRENFIVSEESTGRQFRFGMPGPTLRNTEWKRCLDVVSGIDPKPDYIVASGSLPPGVPHDFYARIARRAGEIGSRMIVDTSGEALRLASEEHVYLLKPNRNELQYLVKEEIKNEQHMVLMAKKILERGYCEALIISLGEAGALFVSKDRYEFMRTPVVPKVSRVGAGDSMVAGMVLNLAKGNSVYDSVRFGIAAGTAAVMTPGTELCRREDTERLYSQMMRNKRGVK